MWQQRRSMLDHARPSEEEERKHQDDEPDLDLAYPTVANAAAEPASAFPQQLLDFFSSCYRHENGTVNLPIEWLDYYHAYGPDTYIDAFSHWVDLHGVPLPGLGRTLPEAQSDFHKLCQLDAAHALVKSQPWQHSFPYRYALSDLTISQCRTGNLCSSFFNSDHRARTPGQKLPSAWEAWTDPRMRRSALRFFKFKAKHDPVALSSATLRGLVGNNVCRASNFSPASAKAVYQLMGARKIYDFSAGWGDRLLAALATPEVHTYIGTDPNVANQDIYDNVLQHFNADIEYVGAAGQVPAHARRLMRVHAEPAEDFRPAPLYGNDFDLAFTSTPYFNCERYAADTQHANLQSWSRYPSQDQWLPGFLFRALDNAIECLRSGGTLAVNIADFGSQKQRHELCDPMNDYLAQRGCRYQGAIGLLLSNKYGTHRSHDLKFGEPIWLWQVP